MPRPTRKRVMDVPRAPAGVRTVTSAIGVQWRHDGFGNYHDHVNGGSADWAMLIRDDGPLTVELPARPEHPKPVWNGSRATVELLAHADRLVTYLAHVASECMQDNLSDDQTVRDMHDQINGLAKLRATLSLIKAGQGIVDGTT